MELELAGAKALLEEKLARLRKHGGSEDNSSVALTSA